MLPAEFLSRLKEIVPADKYDGVLASMEEVKATSFRINTLRGTAPEVLAQLATEGVDVHSLDWYADAFWVSHDQRAALLDSGAYKSHTIYVQNQSSMVPPIVLAPDPEDRVLDLAAAPGSKTLQLACLTAQQGELAAVEVVKKRFFKLKDNLKAQASAL